LRGLRKSPQNEYWVGFTPSPGHGAEASAPTWDGPSAGPAAPGVAGRLRKVNRLLAEGRQAFLRRVSGIERGAECARYESLLSALADREATPEQLAILHGRCRRGRRLGGRQRRVRTVAANHGSAHLTAGLEEGGLVRLVGGLGTSPGSRLRLVDQLDRALPALIEA
jgi:hypothetical protein